MREILLTLLLAVSTYAFEFSCGEPVHKPDMDEKSNSVNPFSWPWQVSLQAKKGISYTHTCGGALIDPIWILTAGKCITEGIKYRIVLGKYDLTLTEGSEQYIEPIKMIAHPMFNPKCLTCGFDLALLKLSWPVVFTDKIRLSCLPSAGEELPDNYTCVVTGWGKLNGNGLKPRKLQQTLLPAVDYNTCSRNDWWGTKVMDTMICVGGYSKNACEGDPGSPLNCFGSDGRWYVNGVGSFLGPVKCNTPKKPSVYTRVSAFKGWINDTMSSN
ncbi:proproteinase E-like isoform X1 [Leucoraja erinacea]|uniref:proproteinase E-like isoform X1 n=2 Tax=Leucoraja erinaceus TaxID=7782 RepID=UPI002455B166|nr:proproteinase E-like isoform X1 [Leucoraja erinacea]